jgi:hypothetical protein
MSPSHPHSVLILGAIHDVSPERLQKAVCGLADGTLTVTLTRTSEADLRGLVRNGDGKEYGVTLIASMTTCSCKDSLYRGVTCKHAVALALFALRQPEAKPEPQADNSHLIHILPATPPARCIHLTAGPTTTGPRLCGASMKEGNAWVLPYVPEAPWPETCQKCWAIHTQPALRAAA